jgi:cytochrome c-type biogenesis protein CcmH/NrfG
VKLAPVGKMNLRFCPQCGTPVTISGARFCIECGLNLAALDAASSPISATPSATLATAAEASPPPSAGARTRPAMAPFIGVFAAILVSGLVVAILILRQLPAREHQLARARPTSPPQSGDGRSLPPGHPQVQLPKEAIELLAKIEKAARANPTDITLWNRFGEVTLRAAAFDPAYYAKASEAFSHVLKLDPDNLDALRGIGNIDFDQRNYDQAIAAYEHYLSAKPDDPEVRTDLGTMYLSTGVTDQAIAQYKKVILSHPTFFEAQFNLGIAYGQMGDPAAAHNTFQQALKLAPDAASRDRVNQMLASLSTQQTASGAAPPAANSSAEASQGAGPVPATFQGALEQMLRDLPIAGPKVQSVQWPAQQKARVLMDNFPMDQMPPFATAKFLSDLKSGIDQVKQTHKVNGTVEVDICDAASGRVMQSVTE